MLHLYRQHLLVTASPLGFVGAMERAQAEHFRREADAWIKAHPQRARELAEQVEKVKRKGGGTVVVKDGLPNLT